MFASLLDGSACVPTTVVETSTPQLNLGGICRKQQRNIVGVDLCAKLMLPPPTHTHIYWAFQATVGV